MQQIFEEIQEINADPKAWVQRCWEVQGIAGRFQISKKFWTTCSECTYSSLFNPWYVWLRAMARCLDAGEIRYVANVIGKQEASVYFFPRFCVWFANHQPGIPPRVRPGFEVYLK